MYTVVLAPSKDQVFVFSPVSIEDYNLIPPYGILVETFQTVSVNEQNIVSYTYMSDDDSTLAWAVAVRAYPLRSTELNVLTLTASEFNP